MKPLLYPLLGLSLLVPVVSNAASLGNQSVEEVCQAERSESYTNGFNDGDANGYSRGYSVGFGDGSAYQVAQCIADPASCGITLASCIPDATYGETEPNDNFIAADPLTLGVSFWGQLYGAEDQDWFYTATTTANQNLLINFSIPDWVDLGEGNTLTNATVAWKVSVRDAAGNVFANFTTNVYGAIESTANSLTYSVTLGLVGTYYIVVEPADKTTGNAYPYAVTAFLQDSSLVNDQPVVGFYDAEIEPNNLPKDSNPLATGVTMYGLINLTFNTVVTDPTNDAGSVWGQGENDWYVYYSEGNEIITLTFCAREDCGPGDWQVAVYDQASAQGWQDLVQAGQPTNSLVPLLSFNTTTTDNPGTVYRLGLKDPGYYFMKVNHKRLFTAPCNEYRYVTSDGGFGGLCTCDSDQAQDTSSTGNSCYLPSDDCSDSQLGLLCRSATEDCTVGADPGCVYNTQSPPGCVTSAPDPDTNEELCSTYVTQARCSCSIYGGVVEVPEGDYTSPYNFTWHATQLPTNTIDTDAYQDYLNRSNPY